MNVLLVTLALLSILITLEHSAVYVDVLVIKQMIQLLTHVLHQTTVGLFSYT